ncbi:MAG: NADPH-dependent FMN reductase [Caldilineaceae bacterium]
MSDVLTIAGSPSLSSRSSTLLTHVRAILDHQGLVTDSLQIRDLNAEELVSANANGATIRAALEKVQQARAVIVATPVYKASYSGVLKAFLDLLPQDGLVDKVVLPIATGASSAHLLAIDYALKPVLSALGAQNILRGLYVQDSQFQHLNGEVTLDVEIEKRLKSQLNSLLTALGGSQSRAFSAQLPNHEAPIRTQSSV